MKNFIILFTLVFLSNYIKNQKPENITIFKISYPIKPSYFYEFTVSKNEIFGFQFSKARGVPSGWICSNISSNIQFLYSTTYDFLYEEYKKEKEEAIANSIRFYKEPMVGGSELYYQVFKALNESDQPISLFYNYYIISNKYTNVTINIWICDVNYKDQCINNETIKCVYNKENKSCFSRPLCDKLEEISENSCDNAVTSNPSLTKCIYDKNNSLDKCSIKNLCINSLTEEECNSAIVLNSETSKCIFNSEKNKCELKEICELEENPSKEKCEQIITSNPLKNKCIFDSIKEKCIIKTICVYVESPSNQNCENSLLSKEKMKCIYEEKNNKCIEEEKLCNEIDSGANDEICLNAKTSKEDTQCIFNEEKNSCEEVNVEKEIVVDNDIEENHSTYNNANNLLFCLLCLCYLF